MLIGLASYSAKAVKDQFWSETRSYAVGALGPFSSDKEFLGSGNPKGSIPSPGLHSLSLWPP